jgi:hypothetical protein
MKPAAAIMTPFATELAGSIEIGRFHEIRSLGQI